MWWVKHYQSNRELESKRDLSRLQLVQPRQRRHLALAGWPRVHDYRPVGLLPAANLMPAVPPGEGRDVRYVPAGIPAGLPAVLPAVKRNGRTLVSSLSAKIIILPALLYQHLLLHWVLSFLDSN